jgi:hypothetical protein
MQTIVKLSATAVAMSLLAACSGNSGQSFLSPAKNTQSGAQTYTQIERLSRPAIKEVFEPFQDHQKSNAAEPYNDSTISADIVTTEDALRPPNTTVGSDYGAFLAKVLYPDEYTVNLNGIAPTATNNDPEFFLSNEVDGSNYFGGRAPNDDVIDLELPVLFGGTLAALKLQPEDNEENNCLSAQNIGTEDPSKKTTSTFPYLPTPH